MMRKKKPRVPPAPMQIENLERHGGAGLRRIFRLQRSAYKIEAQLLGVDSLPPLEETFEEFKRSVGDCFVCRADGETVGAVFLEKGVSSVLISRLMVDPALFRRGIARRLIEHCFARYPNSEFRVGTGTRNDPALRLYASLGFKALEEVVLRDGVRFSKLHRPIPEAIARIPGISAAIRFIKRAHKGQKDMSGKPYWMHPVRVMKRLGPSARVVEKHAALLHDVVEDTKITLDDLRNAGFRADTLAAVELLTRPPNLTYPEYIGRLVRSGNIAAMRVKLADLLDNMDASRAISNGVLHARLLSRHRQAEKRIRKYLPIAHNP